MNMSGGDDTCGVSEEMVRNFLRQDMERYPELSEYVKSIQNIFIISEESISSINYAQDMSQCYSKYMAMGGWNRPERLHIFEISIAHITVYIAYGRG